MARGGQVRRRSFAYRDGLSRRVRIKRAMPMNGDAYLASSLLVECGRPSTVMTSTEASLKIELVELVDDNEEERWAGTGRSANVGIVGVNEVGWVDGCESMARDQVLDDDKSESEGAVV
jgi:hypothetical protein